VRHKRCPQPTARPGQLPLARLRRHESFGAIALSWMLGHK